MLCVNVMLALTYIRAQVVSFTHSTLSSLSSEIFFLQCFVCFPELMYDSLSKENLLHNNNELCLDR